MPEAMWFTLGCPYAGQGLSISFLWLGVFWGIILWKEEEALTYPFPSINGLHLGSGHLIPRGGEIMKIWSVICKKIPPAAQKNFEQPTSDL